MKIIFILLFIVACSTQTRTPTISGDHKVEALTHYRAKDAGDIIRNTNAVTLGVWFKGRLPAQPTEGLFNISVGGNQEAWKTRAGIHVLSSGAFQVVGRAADHDEISESFSPGGLMKENQWQHVAATIDYTNKRMEIFIDGKPVKSEKSLIRFSQSTTSDSPSHHVTLGAEDDGRGAYFNGELADAFVEKKILTADEILKAINRKRP